MSENLNLLLADDDTDDRFFFDKALKVLSIPSALTTVEDGAKLMAYLNENSKQLPDVLFLDLNMPCKNGTECLNEIKRHPDLKHLPVIIYSTSLHEDVANKLYETGAHYYIRKGNLTDLQKTLQDVLTLIKEKKFARPPRSKFILSMMAF